MSLLLVSVHVQQFYSPMKLLVLDNNPGMKIKPAALSGPGVHSLDARRLPVSSPLWAEAGQRGQRFQFTATPHLWSHASGDQQNKTVWNEFPP